MTYTISLEGFTEEEKGRIHHDFMMLLKDRVKDHFQMIVDQGVEMAVSNQEDEIRFIKEEE